MAVRDTSNLPGSLKSTDNLPTQRAVLRCIEEKYRESGSGNMMIERELEVVLPEIVSINGANKCLAGTKVKQYFPLIVFNEDGSRNDAKSDKALARYRDENKALGLPHESIDDENPELLAKGMYIDGTVGSEEYEMSERATPEELAQGIKVGKKKIGDDGKPVVGYKVKLIGTLGKATPVPGQPW